MKTPDRIWFFTSAVLLMKPGEHILSETSIISEVFSATQTLTTKKSTISGWKKQEGSLHITVFHWKQTNTIRSHGKKALHPLPILLKVASAAVSVFFCGSAGLQISAEKPVESFSQQ